MKLLNILLTLTLSGSALAVLLLALRYLLLKKMPSTVYYYAWLLVLLRFALPLPGLVPTAADVPSGTEEAAVAAPVSAERERTNGAEIRWDAVTEALGPFGTGLKIGQGIGKFVSNICFSTDSIIEHFFEMETVCNYINALKTVLSEYEQDYRNYRSVETA